jgi:hypothetical protein
MLKNASCNAEGRMPKAETANSAFGIPYSAFRPVCFNGLLGSLQEKES